MDPVAKHQLERVLAGGQLQCHLGLATTDMPDVDLLIRTGGDFRISNFLLWQTAYSEFYSSETCWPDFFGEQVDQAFESFNERQRRFGKRI